MLKRARTYRMGPKIKLTCAISNSQGSKMLSCLKKKLSVCTNWYIAPILYNCKSAVWVAQILASSAFSVVPQVCRNKSTSWAIGKNCFQSAEELKQAGLASHSLTPHDTVMQFTQGLNGYKHRHAHAHAVYIFTLSPLHTRSNAQQHGKFPWLKEDHRICSCTI